MFAEFSLISDLHKDARGYRPSPGQYTGWTREEMQREWDGLIVELDRSQIEERAAYLRALKTWKANIRAIARAQRVSFATAIRWDLDAEGCIPTDHSREYVANGLDVEHYCWCLHIPFRMERGIRRLLKGA